MLLVNYENIAKYVKVFPQMVCFCIDADQGKAINSHCLISPF